MPSDNIKGNTLLGDKPFPDPKNEMCLLESWYTTTSNKGDEWTPASHQSSRLPISAPKSSGAHNSQSCTIAGGLMGENPARIMSPTVTKRTGFQSWSDSAVSKEPRINERKDLAVPTMTANTASTLPPHLRTNLHSRSAKSVPENVPKVEFKPRLIPMNNNSGYKLTLPSASRPVCPSGSPSPACVTSIAQPRKKELDIPPKHTISSSSGLNRPPTKIMNLQPHTPSVSPKAAPHGASAWANLTGSSELAVNRPARAKNAYKFPAQFSDSTYGSPPAPRPIEIDSLMEKTLFFKTWPGVENRGNRPMPRTIIISNLPRDPTLTMISSICKNTGLIESTSLIPSVNKAMVWFIEATDAQKIFDRSGNGVEFTYSRGGKTHKHVVFIDMKKELDVLASTLRTNVIEKGHTRVVRIVGWARKDLELLSGVKGAKDESFETLLKRLAEKCSPGGKVDKVENVISEINCLGYNEARLVFSGIKEAYHALGQLTRITELEACNITFGRDPCEPEVSLRA